MEDLTTGDGAASGDDAATGDGAADGRGTDDGLVLFWRPGCGFCISLRRSLDLAGLQRHEVNIWEDPRGAEAVRRITGGNETVPTVVVGEAALVNPSPSEVLAAVAEQAPHLLPSP